MFREGDEPIPGYQLERFLGKGQFGQVWQSSSPGRTSVALKFLDLEGKEGWREFRSIQQLKSIRHAHLMPITALWLLDDEGNVLGDDVMDSILAPARQATDTLVATTKPAASKPRWLVVGQLLGDKTLADRLKEHAAEGRTGIPVDELLRYMEEAAKGIDFLNAPRHDLGAGKVSLQHCDIKPANILLTGDSVLICDFGVTRCLADQHAAATATGMVGSPAYMAPESIARKPSAATDQYALAVTYYELRTGQLPFTSLDYVDVIDSHRQGHLDFRAVSAGERKVLQRATSVAPADRFESAGEFVRALRGALAESLPAPGRSRRSSLPWLASAVALAAAIAAGIWLAPRLVVTYAELRVTPVEAEVLIDGQPQQVSPDGVVRIERKKGPQLITVRKPPEFLAATRRLLPEELAASSAITINLLGNAAHYAETSEQQRQSGKWDDAVASYAEAIALDAQYSTVPSPQLWQRPSETMGKIRSLAASTDGRWMAIGTDRGAVRLWDLSGPTKENFHDIQRHAGVVTGVVLSRSAVISFDYSGTVEVNPLPEAQEPRATLQLNPGLVAAQASSDGRWLVTASSRSEDGGAMVEAWDLTAHPIVDSRRRLSEHELSVPALAVSDDSQSVVSVSWDGSVKVRSLVDQTAPVRELAPMAEEAELYGVAILGKRVIFGGARHASDQASRYSLVTAASDGTGSQEFPGGHESTIETLAVSHDGQLLASGSDEGTIQVWRMDSNGLPVEPILLPQGHRARVGGLAFDDENQWLVSGGDDGRILLWDLLGAAPRMPVVLADQLGSIEGLLVLPDGRAAAAGGDGAVRTWDLSQCKLVKRACDKLQIRPRPAQPRSSGTEI